MFQIKSLESTVASIINNVTALTPEVTDFNIGSKARTFIEAFAREIDQFYQSLLKGLMEAIPVSIYKSFSFGRLPAYAASGYVTLTRDVGSTGDIEIPIGTRVKVPNTSFSYSTIKGHTMPSSASVIDILVVADQVGSAGNALAETVIFIDTPISGILSCINDSGFMNGTDEETDNERKVRFQHWVNTLSRAIKAAIEYGALTTTIKDSDGFVTERVTSVLVKDLCVDEAPLGPPGYVEVYVWNGVNGASCELLEETRRVLLGVNPVAGWKAAGVVAHVYAVCPRKINLVAEVEIAPGFTLERVRPSIIQNLDDYFSTIKVGQEVVWPQLVDAFIDTPGVYDVTISKPSVNIVPMDYQMCIKGTVTITERA